MNDIAGNGFAILPGVFSSAEVSQLIEAMARIERHAGVRSWGGVYAVRDLMDASPEVAELARSERVLRTTCELAGALESGPDHLRAGARGHAPSGVGLPIGERRPLAVLSAPYEVSG